LYEIDEVNPSMLKKLLLSILQQREKLGNSMLHDFCAKFCSINVDHVKMKRKGKLQK